MGGGGKLKSSFKISPINVSRKKGFTLAEVLITLAIIGVVAAMTIPAVIVNTNQAEFKTGLRKAVSVLNSAITLNKALTGESPYDNSDLYRYLQQHIAVMKSNVNIYIANTSNYAFYAADGMRYEFPNDVKEKFPLYENKNIKARGWGSYYVDGCGSLGSAHNPDSTQAPPCVMIVDVNGDRNPNNPLDTKKVEISSSGGWVNYYYNSDVTGYKYPRPQDRLLTDIFPILITDQGAIPYGIVAQKAMYQAQK